MADDPPPNFQPLNRCNSVADYSILRDPVLYKVTNTERCSPKLRKGSLHTTENVV